MTYWHGNIITDNVYIFLSRIIVWYCRTKLKTFLLEIRHENAHRCILTIKFETDICNDIICFIKFLPDDLSDGKWGRSVARCLVSRVFSCVAAGLMCCWVGTLHWNADLSLMLHFNIWPNEIHMQSGGNEHKGQQLEQH